MGIENFSGAAFVAAFAFYVSFLVYRHGWVDGGGTRGAADFSRLGDDLSVEIVKESTVYPPQVENRFQRLLHHTLTAALVGIGNWFAQGAGDNFHIFL